MSVSGYTKRLTKEQYDLYCKYGNCILESCYEKGNRGHIIHVHKMEIMINNIIFTIKFPSHYPFRAPDLFINDIPYIKMLKIKLKELKEINIECLCCKSVTCTNNWRPSLKVDDIIEEYFKNKKIINKIIEKRLLNTICINYNIPLELEYYIGDFIICQI